MPEIELDVRYLDPPEPMERAIDALDRLGPDDTLRMLIHREPHPLFQMLRESGYTYKVEQQPDYTYVILIRLRPPPAG
jgi:uncharacterized protein (DUF2249 family)